MPYGAEDGVSDRGAVDDERLLVAQPDVLPHNFEEFRKTLK